MYPDPLSLAATSLFDLGECFSSEHPDFVTQALGDSDLIERQGVDRYAGEQGISIEASVQRLIERAGASLLYRGEDVSPATSWCEGRAPGRWAAVERSRSGPHSPAVATPISSRGSRDHWTRGGCRRTRRG
jgi:hypothetical protein